MIHLRAYKTKLDLSNEIDSYFCNCAGKARFVFNWGLAEWKRQYEAGGKPSKYALKKLFNAIKDEEFPWVRETPYVITQEAFENLGLAFKNFFRRIKQGGEPGYPKFKSKHGKQSFRFIESISTTDTHIKLPRIGWVKLAENGYLPADRPIKQAAVSLDSGHWYVSVLVEEAIEPIETTGDAIGLDMGVAVAVASSDGTLYANERTLQQHEKKLKRLQRELSRRKKGGQNWRKTKAKINKLHGKIRHIRQHTRHNITSDIIYGKAPSVVGIEDLRVKNMTGKAKPKPTEDGTHFLPNKKKQKAGLNRSILEVAPHELRRQLEYKAAWSGSLVVPVNPAYTSQTCSRCGHIAPENRQSQAGFKCVSCGYEQNADLNAAINIRDAALAVLNG